MNRKRVSAGAEGDLMQDACPQPHEGRWMIVGGPGCSQPGRRSRKRSHGRAGPLPRPLVAARPRLLATGATRVVVTRKQVSAGAERTQRLGVETPAPNEPNAFGRVVIAHHSGPRSHAP